jgi:hypothetical protein
MADENFPNEGVSTVANTHDLPRHEAPQLNAGS